MGNEATSVVITAETQQAIDRINAFADKLDGLNKRTENSGNSSRKAGEGMDFFRGKLQEAAALAGGAFTLDRIHEFSKEVYAAALDMEKSNNLLNGALKSTQHAAGLTREEIDKLVDSLSKTTNFDDDGIKKAAAAMLRFRDVQEETFARALPLAADLAAALGTDLVSASQSLGRALENPGTGMRALRAAGVALTEQQADQAEAMRKTGDYAGAQKIVLDALAASVGGTAAGQHGGLTGASADAAKAWDDLLKTIAKTGPYNDTVTGFQENASRRFRILADDIRGIGEAWDWVADHFKGWQEGLSEEQILAKMAAQKKAAADAKTAAEEAEKAAAKAGAEAQRTLQTEQAAYEKKKKATEAAKKAQEQLNSAYDSALRSIEQRIAVTDRELASTSKLTEAQRAYAALMQSMADGPLKNLSAAKKALLQDEALEAEQLEKSQSLREEAWKATDDWLKQQDDEIKNLDNQIERAREYYDQLGLTKAQQADLKASTLDLAAAQKEKTAADQDDIATQLERDPVLASLAAQHRAEAAKLRAEAEKMRELAGINKDTAGKEATVKAAEESQRAWEKFTDQIESSLTDALMRGFENGESFGENFVNSLRNTLKTAALKIAVQAVVDPVMGSVRSVLGGGTDAALTPGGGIGGGINGGLQGLSLLDTLSKGNVGIMNAYGDFARSGFGEWAGLSSSGSLAGPGAGGAAGLTSMGNTVGSLLPYAPALLSLAQGNTGGAVGGAIGAYFGGPIGGAIGSAIGGSLFGGGGEDPHDNASVKGFNFGIRKSGIYGNTNNDGVSGPSSFVAGATSGSGWWADDSNLSAAQIKAINAQVTAVFASGAEFAKLLGVDPKVINSASVDSRYNGTESNGRIAGYFSSVDQALNALSVSILQKVIPNLKSFQQTGEKLADTAQRLGVEFQLTDEFAQLLGKDADTAFGAAGVKGLSARDDLVKLLGGSQNAAGVMAGYKQNFFSQDERDAQVKDSIAATFKSLGLGDLPESDAQFRDLVAAQDLSTKAGREMAATLLSISDAFHSVSQSADEAAKALADALSPEMFATAADFHIARAQTLAGQSIRLPRFAAGGDHAGGWAVVGENGPELANLGASHIYSNADSKSLLDLSPLISEVQRLRREVEQIRSATGAENRARNTAMLDAVDFLRRLTNDGFVLRSVGLDGQPQIIPVEVMP